MQLVPVAIALVLAGAVGAPLGAFAQSASQTLDADDFRVRSTEDLVDLCSPGEDSEYAVAAIHFCHGFMSGAYRYHQAQAAGDAARRLVCPPDPPPTRNEAVAAFVSWARARPQYLAEPAIDSLFRFLVETWPCPAAAGGAAEGDIR